MPQANAKRAFRIGVAGPVGSGKTALVDRLSRRLWPKYNLAVVTNDIYTKEDAEFLLRQGVLPAERVRGVETGACPHAAIREDASMDLLVINKIDLAPYVGASLEVMERDSRRMRGERLFLFTNLRADVGLDEVIAWLEEKLGVPASSRRMLIDAHAPYVGVPHTHGEG